MFVKAWYTYVFLSQLFNNYSYLWLLEDLCWNNICHPFPFLQKDNEKTYVLIITVSEVSVNLRK